MSLDIVVTSENIGSNPGGRCLVKTHLKRVSEESYIKYCNRTQTPPSFSFSSQRQPIYEAMFLEMAKMLGLVVPEYAVILNPQGKHVNFIYEPEKNQKVKKLNSNNHSYFLSRLIDHIIDENHPKLRGVMADEKIYRDLLNIGNVSDRPDNYTLVDIKGKEPFVLYIDFGCGFVDAHEGILTIRPSLIRQMSKLENGKALKNLKKRLGKINLKIDRGTIINLFDFGERIPGCCKINVLDASNPHFFKSMPVNSLLSKRELDDLSKLYFITNSTFLKNYKGDERLFKKK
ncbi:MAG: hypothetical protein KKF48_01290 [Nanoarchaeota archaeon]|nr:hypothetical protein [Nanoarchaeota archaeon]MBU1027657.1 hypothetical protein [Nanoarchaeota archaeon]